MLEQNNLSFPKDNITGFYSRENLFSFLSEELKKADQAKEKLSVLLIDIDHFKRINDRYGHLCGDDILRYFASTLRLLVYNEGIIFRYGGDEFVIVLPRHNALETFFLGKQINWAVKNRPCLHHGKLFRVTLSIGTATYREDAHDAESLLAQADRAMYVSKKYGRNVTTQASKVKWFKVRIFFTILAEIILVFFIFLGIKNLLFSKFLSEQLDKIGLVKVSARYDYLDTLVLKSGSVLRGKIIGQDANAITLSLSTHRQQAQQLNIERSQIERIYPARFKGGK
jgi:diguanylate cyclase (GGDEF)-like protein